VRAGGGAWWWRGGARSATGAGAGKQIRIPGSSTGQPVPANGFVRGGLAGLCGLGIQHPAVTGAGVNMHMLVARCWLLTPTRPIIRSMDTHEQTPRSLVEGHHCAVSSGWHVELAVHARVAGRGAGCSAVWGVLGAPVAGGGAGLWGSGLHCRHALRQQALLACRGVGEWRGQQ
jgi:hypothetical protein